MGALTCARCGSPARQLYGYLTTKDGCEQFDAGIACTNETCLAEQRVEDARDQRACDAAAIADAVARGVIDP